MIGGRLKPKRLPPPREATAQMMLCRWLDFRGEPYFAVGNGVKIGGRNRGAMVNKLKQLGMRPGAPDLVMVRLSAIGPVAVEMKREGSTASAISDAQTAMHAKMRERGWVVVIGKGYDDARRQLEDLGF